MRCTKTALAGYAVVALCLLSLEASVAAVQTLQAAIPDFELSAIRYIGAIAVSVIWLLIKRDGFNVSINQYVPLVTLGLASLFYNVFYFYAVAILPLSHTEALMVSSRVICFVILATMRKRINLNIFIIVSIIGCALGVVLIVQPWKTFNHGFIPRFLDTNKSIPKDVNITGHTDVDIRGLVTAGYLFSIASGAVDAIYFYTSAFHLRSMPSALQCFFTACFCVPASLLVSIYTEKLVINMSLAEVSYAALHSVSTGIYLITINGSFQLLDSVQVTILLNCNAVLILIPQYTFLNEHLFGRRNIAEVFGCVAIFVFITLGSIFSVKEEHEDFKSKEDN